MKPTFFATPAAFRSWLAANSTVKTELIVGFYKKATGKPSMTWSESVDEALCFGWIDGIRRSHGDDAYTIRFTPRKPTSIWSAVNVAKIEALRAAGKMLPAGEAAYAKRTPEKTGIYAFERDTPAHLAPEHQARFTANASAYAWFTSQAPSWQRATLHWVIGAKQEATRERRFAALLAASIKKQRVR